MAKLNPHTAAAKLDDALNLDKSKNTKFKDKTKKKRGAGPSNTTTNNAHDNVEGGGLKEEVFEDYLLFRQRLKEIEKERLQYSPKPDIFLMFSGSYENGRSWCGLCNPVNEYIKKEIIPRYKKRGYLLWIRVGDFEEWANPRNPYRIDPKIKIQRIPALIVWTHAEKRMQGIDMILFNLIKEAFDLNFEADDEEKQQELITF